MFTLKSLPSNIACHDSLDPLFQTLGIWIQGSGLRDTCHQRLLFQICWKIRIDDSRLDNYFEHEHLTASM
jgi:hypothetical protein